jgi:hypothetical protein
VDPATLAAAATGLLAGVLNGGLTRAGESAADAATRKLGELFRAVKNKFAGDAYHAAILDGADSQPDETRLKHLEDVLRESLDEDREFAAGDIAMTGHNVAGRDLYIGGEPQPPSKN